MIYIINLISVQF